MEAYLDNAATTQVAKEVANIMVEVMTKVYGNPSSLHKKGIAAEKILVQTRTLIAKYLGVLEKEIIFTSGGTEANNLAISGILKAGHRRGKHLIISAFEHPSVFSCAKSYEAAGYEVSIVPVTTEGFVDQEALALMIRPDTLLVAIMQVNNEIGTIQDIEGIGQLIKTKNGMTHFHVDGVQGFGKSPINLKKCKVDSYSLSAHKIHGPKGVGALYLQSKAVFTPMLQGGSQQRGLRSGTENVPGIAGLYVATQLAFEHSQGVMERLDMLKNRLYEGITSELEGVHVNGSLDKAVPHILNLRLDNVRGEVLLHALEANDIYVSTGAACASTKTSLSQTLKALGLADDQIDGSIRLSLSRYTTEEEIDACILQLVTNVPKLRRFVRK